MRYMAIKENNYVLSPKEKTQHLIPRLPEKESSVDSICDEGLPNFKQNSEMERRIW